MMGAGVPAVVPTPRKEMTSYPGSVSAMAGTSGRALARAADVTTDTGEQDRHKQHERAQQEQARIPRADDLQAAVFQHSHRDQTDCRGEQVGEELRGSEAAPVDSPDRRRRAVHHHRSERDQT